jgi:hypothetical protein
VVKADLNPSRVLTLLKGAATQKLKQEGEETRRRFWARGGSKKYLWNPTMVYEAVEYVVNGQGEPMAVFQLPWEQIVMVIEGCGSHPSEPWDEGSR